MFEKVIFFHLLPSKCSIYVPGSQNLIIIYTEGRFLFFCFFFFNQSIFQNFTFWDTMFGYRFIFNNTAPFSEDVLALRLDAVVTEHKFGLWIIAKPSIANFPLIFEKTGQTECQNLTFSDAYFPFQECQNQLYAYSFCLTEWRFTEQPDILYAFGRYFKSMP